MVVESKWAVLEGNALELLRALPANHFHVCVTSPPYWSLRDYEIDPTVWYGSWSGPAHRSEHDWFRNEDAPQGEWCRLCSAWKGCYGLEPSPEMFYENTVTIFREIRRVMRKDGTVWVNMGDSFWGPRSFEGDEEGTDGVFGRKSKRLAGARRWEFPKKHPYLKLKDIVMQPAGVAQALQRDGWWIRMDNVWYKPNTMPGSTGDRPNKAHEFVFLCAQSSDYFYDGDAVREPWSDAREGKPGGKTMARRGVGGRLDGYTRPAGTWEPPEGSTGRNLRSVWFFEMDSLWEIPAKGFESPVGEHYATFPPGLPVKAILAGTSERGCCEACGAPYERMVEKGEADLEHQRACGGSAADGSYDGKAVKGKYKKVGAQDPSEVKARILEGMRERKTVGWKKTCKCSTDVVVPCRVIDPFTGSGTTGEQCRLLNRDFTGCELNPESIAVARDRIRSAFQKTKKAKKPDPAQKTLFGVPVPVEEKCPECGGSGEVDSTCNYPHCGRSGGDDHACNLGGKDPCPKCRSKEASKTYSCGHFAVGNVEDKWQACPVCIAAAQKNMKDRVAGKLPWPKGPHPTAKDLGIKGLSPETFVRHIADQSACMSDVMCPDYHYEAVPAEKLT